jgi:hypothetical protein
LMVMVGGVPVALPEGVEEAEFDVTDFAGFAQPPGLG